MKTEEEEIAFLVHSVAEKRREQIRIANKLKTWFPGEVRGVKFDLETCRHRPWTSLLAMASRVADELLDLGFPALWGKTEIRIDDYHDCVCAGDGFFYSNTSTIQYCPIYTILVGFYVKRRFHDPEPEAVIAKMRETRRKKNASNVTSGTTHSTVFPFPPELDDVVSHAHGVHRQPRSRRSTI